jgi:4a-hydroxytetrahydrobiopterin dehydratase
MKLTSDQIETGLRGLAGWERDGEAIRRQFTFAGFPDAVAFVVRVGFGAEAVDHHPDILVNYKRVTLTYTTHSEGGLTEKDFAGAKAADAIAAAMGSRS